MSCTLHIDNGIAILTLNAPPHNRMNAAFFRAFSAIVRQKLPRCNVRGMIMCGAGRHFSSGADIDELRNSLRKGADLGDASFLADNTADFLAIERLPYPVVAAINGCCLGAGLELALACHARLATPRSVLGFPEASLGVMPGCGGTVRCARLLGPGKAAELLLSCRMLLGPEAHALGLIDAVVAPADLMTAARMHIDGKAATQ